MAKTSVDSIVNELAAEQTRLQNQLRRVSAALAALGKVRGSKSKASAGGRIRTISAAGRRRIAAAQRARWAKVRAAKQGK
jgi:hypothetical protein